MEPIERVEDIVINQRLVRLKIEKRSLDGLQLDPNNARFSHEVFLEHRNLTEAYLEEAIWKEPDTRELYNAIISNGGLTVPLIITNDGIVKEGNRRLVCLRHLKEQIQNGEGPKFPISYFENIEVQVLPVDITQLELDILLGLFHVSGKKEWKAINQADHIYHMIDKEGLTLEKVADLLGKSKPYIFQKKYAYEMTVEFLKRFPNRTISDFSFFEEYFKKRKSLEALVDKESLFNWIANGKFDETGAKDVRQLPEVLSKQQVREVFLREGMRAARLELARYDPSVSSATFADVKAAIESLRTMPRNEFEGISGNQPQIGLLKELYNELDRVFKNLGIDPKEPS